MIACPDIDRPARISCAATPDAPRSPAQTTRYNERSTSLLLLQSSHIGQIT